MAVWYNLRVKSAADIFGLPKALVGMVHVGALPGTPRASESVDRLAARAAEEARLLIGSGFDAVIVENMHDAPYLRREVGPEIVSAMTMVSAAVRAAVTAPIGVQVLAGANRAALAIAHSVGLDFIRAEGFVFASVADEGLLDEADAGPLLRYRKMLGAEGIAVLADIKKKHSAHAITADISIADTARNAEFFGADGLIVTGISTGAPASLDDLRGARAGSALPLAVGSGATPENIASLFGIADAVIVGSWYKAGGDWRSGPDPARVRQLVKAAKP